MARLDEVASKDAKWMAAYWDYWEYIHNDTTFGPQDSPVWWRWEGLQKYHLWTASDHLQSFGLRLN